MDVFKAKLHGNAEYLVCENWISLAFAAEHYVIASPTSSSVLCSVYKTLKSILCDVVQDGYPDAPL